MIWDQLSLVIEVYSLGLLLDALPCLEAQAAVVASKLFHQLKSDTVLQEAPLKTFLQESRLILMDFVWAHSW